MESVARRLVAREVAASGGGATWEAAIATLHQTLFESLAPLIGASGARALLIRAVVRTKSEHPCLHDLDLGAVTNAPVEDAWRDDASLVIASLRGADDAAALKCADILYAAVLTVLERVIGERLTLQIVERAWPNFDVNASSEETE